MLSKSLIWIVVVVLGILVLVCVVVIVRKIAAQKRLSRETAHANKTLRIIALNASTLRGNFVRTHKTEPIQNDYILDTQRDIGRGGCGVVITGVCKNTQALHAIKIVLKKTADINRLERELKLLKNVDHTNIVRLFSVYDSPFKVYFVMELCRGGHLGNLLARQTPIHGHKILSEDWARRLSRQLLSAIVHMHSRGIAHRDIKLQNVLLDVDDNDQQAQIKVIDFGFGSCYVGALPMRTKCGTLYTTAPEVIRECYDERCDVWSAGVVIFTLLCGKRPFEVLQVSGAKQEAGKAAMATNILAGRYHMKHRTWTKVSKIGQSFVKDLLYPDYTHRMTSAEALEHPWLNDSSIHGDQNSMMKSSKSFRAVHNLKKAISNDNNNALKTAGSTALVFGLQPNSVADLRGVFQAMDRDGSGALSLNEFAQALQILAPELSAEDVERIFNIVDLDNNHQLSYTEFLIAAIDPRDVDIEELNNAFSLIDADGNGEISRSEMQELLCMQWRSRLSQVNDPSNPIERDLSDMYEGRVAEGSNKSNQSNNPSNPCSSPQSSSKCSSPKAPSRHQSIASVVIDKSASPSSHERTMSIGNIDTADDRPLLLRTMHEQVEQLALIQSHVDQIFDKYDVNKDGTISYAEFLYAMTGLDFYLHDSSFTTRSIAENSGIIGDREEEGDFDATLNPLPYSKQSIQDSHSTSENYDASDDYDEYNYPISRSRTGTGIKHIRNSNRLRRSIPKRGELNLYTNKVYLCSDANEMSGNNNESESEVSDRSGIVIASRRKSGSAYQSGYQFDEEEGSREQRCDEEDLQESFNSDFKTPPTLFRDNSRKTLGGPDSPLPLFLNKSIGSLLVRQSSNKSIHSEKSGDLSDFVDDDIENRSGFTHSKHLLDHES